MIQNFRLSSVRICEAGGGGDSWAGLQGKQHILSELLCLCGSVLLHLQKAEASDDDEEGKALMIKPGTSSAKDDKENDAFFKKVRPDERRRKTSILTRVGDI